MDSESTVKTPVPMPARGVLAPMFMSLAIGAGVLQFCLDSRALVWLGLGSLALGLHSSRYTRRLFEGPR